MDRRTFLKTTAGAGALVATGGLSAPAIAQAREDAPLRAAGEPRQLRSDLGHAIRGAQRRRCWCGTRSTASTKRSTPQRQMVESEETSSDGLTWTFKLRSGLKFHDGSPVLAKDVRREPDALDARATRWA